MGWCIGDEKHVGSHNCLMQTSGSLKKEALLNYNGQWMAFLDNQWIREPKIKLELQKRKVFFCGIQPDHVLYKFAGLWVETNSRIHGKGIYKHVSNDIYMWWCKDISKWCLGYKNYIGSARC